MYGEKMRARWLDRLQHFQPLFKSRAGVADASEGIGPGRGAIGTISPGRTRLNSVPFGSCWQSTKKAWSRSEHLPQWQALPPEEGKQYRWTDQIIPTCSAFSASAAVRSLRTRLWTRLYGACPPSAVDVRDFNPSPDIVFGNRLVRMYFLYGSKADVMALNRDVRFVPKAVIVERRSMTVRSARSRDDDVADLNDGGEIRVVRMSAMISPAWGPKPAWKLNRVAEDVTHPT